MKPFEANRQEATSWHKDRHPSSTVFRWRVATLMMITAAGLILPAQASTAVSPTHITTTSATATKDAPLVLYYRNDCPYCWNVLTHLSDQHRTLPMKEISESFDAATELIQGGGKRQVPCLRIRENNGNKVTWLYQSGEIITYLDEHPQ